MTAAKCHGRMPPMLGGLAQFLLFIGLGCGHEDEVIKSPRVAVSPSVLDLGRFEVGEQSALESHFVISNLGTGTLHLTGFLPSCDCTVPQNPPSVLPPNSQNRVVVKVRPKNESGNFNSSITIQTDDPATPIVRVEVKWSELSQISVSAKHLNLGRVKMGETKETDVEVLVSERFRPKDLRVTSAHPNVTTGWKVVPVETSRNPPGFRKALLSVRVTADREQGEQSADLRISDAANQYVERLLISWKSGPPLEVSPSAVFESDAGGGGSRELSFLLKSSDGRRVHVKSVTVNGKEVAHSSRKSNDGNGGLEVVSIVLAKDAAAAIERKTLVIHDEVSDEKISIPITFIHNVVQP